MGTELAATFCRYAFRRHSPPGRRGRSRVPLARILGNPDPAGGAPREARPLPDRPEPALETRRDDDERRRLRRRLVRGGRAAEALSQHAPGLERPQSPRARRRDLVAAVSRAHPRLDRDGDPGDQHPSVPLRQLALDAQRPDPRVPADQARARARGRRLAVPLHRGHDRLRDDVLPRAHVRPRGRSRGRRRAGGGLRRGDGAPARGRAPDPDDGRDDATGRASGRSGTRARASRGRSSSAREWTR